MKKPTRSTTTTVGASGARRTGERIARACGARRSGTRPGRTGRWRVAVLAAALGTAGALAPAGWVSAARAGVFETHWRDGRAELDGYRLRVNRYGQERTGTAVMIFVTEPFSESKRVKVDDPSANPGDTFEALKLNLVRDFQTGIYDYNTMTSVFVHADDFRPSKVSFSSAEWCGHVYGERLFDETSVRLLYRSYFEDESMRGKMARPAGGIPEENLFILLRGLRGDFLPPGGRRELTVLPSAFVSRLTHGKLAWVRATVEREASTRRVTVPAGTFEVMRYRVRVGDSREGEFDIETAYPHRIVRWSLAPDVEGVLAGSARLPYWKLNHEGEERYLHDLGLR